MIDFKKIIARTIAKVLNIETNEIEVQLKSQKELTMEIMHFLVLN